MRSLIILIILVSGSIAGHTQRSYYGLFQELALNMKVKEVWKLTAKFESQHVLFADDQLVENEWRYGHDRTDLQFYAARNLTARTKAAMGYQYRLNGDGDNTHRVIQQIGWLSNFRNYRLGHRVRTDQTFLSEGLSWRLRYRLSSDIPVNGQQLDPGEKYFIASNELISELYNEEFSLENRLVAGLGWYFENKHKFELSMDYRLDPIVTSPMRNRTWLKFSLYLNF